MKNFNNVFASPSIGLCSFSDYVLVELEKGKGKKGDKTDIKL